MKSRNFHGYPGFELRTKKPEKCWKAHKTRLFQDLQKNSPPNRRAYVVLKFVPLDKSDSKNRSRFICTAIKYYIAYLEREPNTEILTPIYEENIDKRLDLTERRLSKTLFKLAAEMAFTMNILAGTFKLDPDKLKS